MGARRRRRKQAQVDVLGELAIAPRMPQWERELLLAAFAAIATSDATPEREAVDAKR